jgi:hypothetical protein
MKQSIVLLSLLTAGLLGASCVKVDNSLGKGLVDKNLIFSTIVSVCLAYWNLSQSY